MYKVTDFGAMATIVAPPSFINHLKKALTVSTKNMMSEEITDIALYEHVSEDTIKIPIGLVKKEEIPQKFFKQQWQRKEIKTNIVLRPAQKRLVEEFLSKLHIGGILCAKTGTGKSVMGIELIARLGYKALIIVPLTSLVDQWRRNILYFTNIQDHEIGIIQGSRCDFKSKKVCIGMLHTLAKEKYPEIVNEFGTVVYDEVHKLGAETFSVVAKMFNCRYRIGLSATPRRKDGAEKVFYYNIGDIIANDNRLDITPEVVVLNYTHAECAGTYNKWDNKFNLGKYLTKLSLANTRNQIILQMIAKLHKANRNILVLCDRISHVKWLYHQLKTEMGLSGIGMWIGEQKDKGKQVLLATHGSCGIGVDIPELDTLIFASPRADVEQPVGRILRLKEGKKTPLVIDIVDMACKEMRLWAKAREKFYKRIGAKITVKYVGG